MVPKTTLLAQPPSRNAPSAVQPHPLKKVSTGNHIEVTKTPLIHQMTTATVSNCNDGENDRYSQLFIRIRDMIDKNEAPDVNPNEIEQMPGHEVSILRRKLRDATKNNIPS